MSISIEKNEFFQTLVKDGDTVIATFDALYDAYDYVAARDVTLEPSLKTARRLRAYRDARRDRAPHAWVERNLALCPDIPPDVHTESPYTGNPVTLTEAPDKSWRITDAVTGVVIKEGKLYMCALALARRDIVPVITADVYPWLKGARAHVAEYSPKRIGQFDRWMTHFAAFAPADEPPPPPVLQPSESYRLSRNQHSERWVIHQNDQTAKTYVSLHAAVSDCIQHRIYRIEWTPYLQIAFRDLLRHLPRHEKKKFTQWHKRVKKARTARFDIDRTPLNQTEKETTP